jgi:hypothetical protein
VTGAATVETTYKIKEDEGEYYWFLSQPGRPGTESDGYFPTEAAAVADVTEKYPEAVRVY